jgi:hypothetical protein
LNSQGTRSATVRSTRLPLSIAYGSLIVEDIGINCVDKFELLDVVHGRERLRREAMEAAAVVLLDLYRKCLVGSLCFSLLAL